LQRFLFKFIQNINFYIMLLNSISHFIELKLLSLDFRGYLLDILITLIYCMLQILNLIFLNLSIICL